MPLKWFQKKKKKEESDEASPQSREWQAAQPSHSLPAESGGAESHSKLPHDFKLEPHGLFILYPAPELPIKPSELQVDIVAVHGLNGTAKETWIDKRSGRFWLEEFLPDAIPKARIMTFGYDSGLAFSKSKAGVEHFARDLLNRLWAIRNTTEAENRPFIFIAHSLGGIVVKKALILAHEAQGFYGSILKSTTGIVFMGTPHRGSELASWTGFLSRFIKIASLGQGLRYDLLSNLETNSGILMDISRQFVHRATSIKIMTFIEQQIEPPLLTLVVPEYSAVLDLPNEMILPLNAHHRDMCRYSSKESQNYILVEAAIKELAIGKSAHAGDSTKILTSTAKNVAAITPIVKTAGATAVPIQTRFQRSAREVGEVIPSIYYLDAESAIGVLIKDISPSEKPSAPSHDVELFFTNTKSKLKLSNAT